MHSDTDRGAVLYISRRTFEMTESEDDGSATDGDEKEQDLPNDDGFDENETEPVKNQ